MRHTDLVHPRSLPLGLAAIALTLSACGVFTETTERAGEVDNERVQDAFEEIESEPNEDFPIGTREEDTVEEDPVEESTPDGSTEQLDEIIDDVEASEEEPVELLPAPEITLREIDGATPEVIEHIANVEAFWTEVAVELDFEYVEVDVDRLFPRSTIGDDGEDTCSFRRIVEPLDADVAEFNAYVAPCSEGITVVWDDILLETDLEERFPGVGMAMLISHEWGHVVQLERQQVNQSDIVAEQQADCYSGAYAAWAEDRGIEPFTSDQALDFAIISTLETRDAVGSRPEAFGAHGNGFDRVRATQDGYDRGVTFCAGYDVTPPPVTQTGFTTARDRQNEGNLSFDDAFELLVPAVVDYYESLSSESLEEFVDEPDERILRNLHATIGDLSVGTEYALRYGAALQEANGDAIAGVGPALQRACLAGSFLNDARLNGIEVEVPSINDPTELELTTLTLSPGDLDEAITTLTSSDELLSNPGVVFEMVAALRVGTLDGIDACALA